MFPRVPDQHKPDKPMIPNGIGAFYVLFSSVYLFIVYSFNLVSITNDISKPLTLAVCILFGGFLGLLDDWMDVKWRYKAFLPIIAAIPLIVLASRLGLRATIAIPFLGTLDFGQYYYFIIIPLLVTVFTNTINMLGGLNGLETVCPAVVMIGLMAISGENAILLYGPLAMWLLLAILNFRGKIFVGNTGSFAIGMTLAAFAIISDLKFVMAISLLPYIFNSVVILLTVFLFRTKAAVRVDNGKLVSDHRRSLVTLVTYRRPLTERQVVAIITFLVAITTLIPVLFRIFS